MFLSNKVIVHSFTNTPQRLSVFETSENEAGVCALCPNTANALLAFPAKTVGQVQIVDIGNARKFSSVIKVGARDGRHRDPRGQRLTSRAAGLDVQAHESSISCIALNADGTRVATASEKGTLVRVFDTSTANKLVELRRGVDHCTIRRLGENGGGRKGRGRGRRKKKGGAGERALGGGRGMGGDTGRWRGDVGCGFRCGPTDSYERGPSVGFGRMGRRCTLPVDRAGSVVATLSLCFNFDTTRIAVTSDKGTVHVFELDANKNRTSSYVAGRMRAGDAVGHR